MKFLRLKNSKIRMFRYFNFRLIMILMPCPRLYMIENSRDENYVHTLIISHAKEITFTPFRVDFFGMLRPKIKRTERISGNAVDKKNLHPGNSKFIFLIDSPDILFFFFYFLLFFLFICSFVWCFFKLKMYILIHIRFFTRLIQDYFFFLAS